MRMISWCGSLDGPRDWLWSHSSIAGPDQHGAILVDGQLVDLDDFGLQILEILVIQAKLSLEGAIRYTSLALEHGECLIQDFLQCHGQPSAGLVSAAGYG